MHWIVSILKIGNDVQQKGWYASKTVWFNILSFVAAIAALKGLNLNADDIVAIAGGVSTIGNIILRLTSETPVGAKTIPNDVSTDDVPTVISSNTANEFDNGTTFR